MSAAQGLALKLRAAPPGSGRRRAPRARPTVTAAYGGALQHRGCGGVSLGSGLFIHGAPLTAAPERARAALRAPCAARRHGVVVASAAAEVRSMSKVPESSIGLYNPSFERDSCGVGFIAELSAEPTRKTVSSLPICN